MQLNQKVSYLNAKTFLKYGDNFMPFKIIQKHNECIGCGACAAISPNDWKMDGDKATLVGAKKEGNNLIKVVASVGSNEDAANACPVRCITIEKTK